MRLEELSDLDFSIVEDKVKDKPRMKVLATFQQSDTVNKNGRVYPHAVLNSAMKEFQSHLKRGFGELDHPLTKGRLTNTSHMITALKWDEKNPSLLNCELLVLETPSGKALKEILRAGGRPGLSSRGQGDSATEKRNGKTVEIIKPGFRFDGIDFVLNPSVKSTGVKKIYESAEVKDETLPARRKKKLTAEEEAERTERIKGRARAVAGLSSK